MSYIGVVIELERTCQAAVEARAGFPPGLIEIEQVSSYDEGVAAARAMVRGGAKALITRAGYTTHLRGADLTVPVIEIPFTMSNITQTCVEASRTYGRVGIAGTQFVIEQARALDSVLGDSIKYYWAAGPADYRKIAEQARQDGMRALVGGYDETKYAQSVGIARVILDSGVEEMREAMSEAMKIVRQIQVEAKKNEELKTLFDIINDALILFDAEGRIVQLNRRTGKMLGLQHDLVPGSPIEVPALNASVERVLRTGVDLPYDLQENNGHKYICSIRPVMTDQRVSGAVAKLQSVEYVQSMEHSTRARLSERGLTASYRFDRILGASPQIRDAIQMAKQYSAVDSTVLISGESGTGKELFAQSIHNYSRRADGPFVAINCATLPTSLLESELFGYSEGAFTGAKRGGKLGLFELAHNGTLFLDEIGEIDLPIQARLLRVIEEKRVMRLGDDKIIPVNVRIIAATNQNLLHMVREGRFRRDLFFRLNILTLYLPPVRERKGDLPMLLAHFLELNAERMDRARPSLSEEAMELLTSYDWPGNVREISNVAERLTVIGGGSVIGRRSVLELMQESFEAEPPHPPSGSAEAPDPDLERIRAALETCGGNKSAAAALLGISRPTLYRKLRGHPETLY